MFDGFRRTACGLFIIPRVWGYKIQIWGVISNYDGNNKISILDNYTHPLTKYEKSRINIFIVFTFKQNLCIAGYNTLLRKEIDLRVHISRAI